MPTDAPTLRPFLTFEGRAREAMEFYISLFDDGEILSLTPHPGADPGSEPMIMLAEFRVAGQRLLVSDSTVHHKHTFTPSLSLCVTHHDAARIEQWYQALLDGGEALMPLDDYGFSGCFGWVNDRFGVSWQLLTS